jgi:hypothetical protein
LWDYPKLRSIKNGQFRMIEPLARISHEEGSMMKEEAA